MDEARQLLHSIMDAEAAFTEEHGQPPKKLLLPDSKSGARRAKLAGLGRR
jgi:hypothetical protein